MRSLSGDWPPTTGSGLPTPAHTGQNGVTRSRSAGKLTKISPSKSRGRQRLSLYHLMPLCWKSCNLPRGPPSGKRTKETISTRIAAGTQPRGSALPQLLPDGLSPDVHLKMARSLTHPICRPPILPRQIGHALANQVDDAKGEEARILEVLDILDKLSKLL